MNRTPGRILAALLTVVLASAYASAQRVEAARATLAPAFGAVAAPGSPSFAGSVALSPALSAPAAFAPLIAAVPAAPIPTVAAAEEPLRRVAPALQVLALSAALGGSRQENGRGDGGAAFDGSAVKSPSIINDEGVEIGGRAASYYGEVRRMVELYKGKINLAESLAVMDDAYAEVLAKISAVEAVARGRGVSRENTHLNETLVWVDGVLSDGRKKIAVHTHRVFFHKSKEPKSEIAEGIRRVDGYLADAEKMFARGGKADRQTGKLDEVVLVFDARGYREIKDHLKIRGAEMSARTGGRIAFKFLDDLAPLPADQTEIRTRLNALSRKYNGKGLSKIYEGVIYSRYVGLLLELKTVEHYHKLGYRILQSGRELFDKNGMYISELDVVVESPEGVVSVVEAKSARVGLPDQEILRGKVVYKLETYRKFKTELDAMIGRKFDAVVFAMDVALDLELMEFLKSKEAALSKEYGFPVSFLFLSSGPSAR